MKSSLAFAGLGGLVGFVAGAVVALVVLSRRLGAAVEAQKEIERLLAELKADMETANTEMLILRAELDLRQEQMRRLLESHDDQWRGLN